MFPPGAYQVTIFAAGSKANPVLNAIIKPLTTNEKCLPHQMRVNLNGGRSVPSASSMM
jgi:hypothetical protein